MLGKRTAGLAAVAIAASLVPLALAQDRSDSASLERRYIDDLADRPYFQYSRIDARVDGHAMTLVGKVARPIERALAELLARNQLGVGAVRNELELDPSLPRWLPGRNEEVRWRARNVLRRVRQDPTLGQFTTIHAFADGLEIVLRGVMASRGQVKTASVLAKSVAGPFGVRNEIQVDPRASRAAPAAEADEASQALAEELDRLVRRDALLQDCAFEVSVRGRRVALSGQVHSLVEHDYACELIRARLRSLERLAPAPRRMGAFERRLSGLAHEAVGIDDTAEVHEESHEEGHYLVSNLIVL